MIDVLRHSGWTAVGTSDPWEAISLVSQRDFNLILLDRNMGAFGTSGFTSILADDPVLSQVPRILFNRDGGCSPAAQEALLASVRNVLDPRFPSEEPSSTQTRFVRRRRPAALPQAV
jgi:CheY-like chemotaxis protein